MEKNLDPNLKLIIFDFDGTIADTFSAMIQISNQLAKIFHFKQVSDNDINDLKHQNVHFIIQHLKIPKLRIPQIIARAQKELAKEIHLIKPIDGLKEILTHLKNNNYQLGILTTNSKENVSRFIEYHNLPKFDFIQSCPRLFSKHRILDKIIRKRKLQKINVWYVGDEIRDLEAAQKIKIKSIAVGWGYNSPQALGLLDPDYLIEQPEELLKIFNH